MAHFLSTGIRNAAWLLCGYWVAAIAVELVSKFWPSPGVMMAIRVLEHFPEKVLHIFGLLAPLEEAMQGGEVSIVQARLVYGAAVLVGFVALSMLTGLCLWFLQRVLRYWVSKY
jgi:hypothetical protein